MKTLNIDINQFRSCRMNKILAEGEPKCEAMEWQFMGLTQAKCDETTHNNLTISDQQYLLIS